MANVWKLTSAGRAALMDGANRGTRAITMRTIAVGDGSGVPTPAATTSRTTLRNRRDSAAAAGATAVSGRIAVRASIVPSATYDVTEVGLFSQIGQDPEILFAYWTDGGRVLVSASADATTVVAGVLDIADAVADVTVTVSPTVVLSGVAALVDLSDTPAALVAGSYLRAVSPEADALENVPPATVLHDLLSGLGLAAGDFTRVVAQGGSLGLEGVDLLSGAPAALDTLNELAAALSDDANFAATVAAQLADAGRLATGTVDRDRLPPVGYTVQRGTAAAPNTGHTNDKFPVEVTVVAVDLSKTYLIIHGHTRFVGGYLANATTIRCPAVNRGAGFNYQLVESD